MAKPESGEMEKTRITLESTLESVDEAEAIVLKAAKDVGFDEDQQNDIGMAVRECVVNAVVHGNRYSQKKQVHLEIDPSRTALAVVVGDEGAGFDIKTLPDPLKQENLLNQSGRGLLLIRAFMDDFDLHPREGGGTEIRLIKNLNRAHE